MSSPVAADAASNGTPIHHTVSRPVRATPAQVFAGLRDFQLHPTKYLNTASDAVIIENTKEHIKRSDGCTHNHRTDCPRRGNQAKRHCDDSEADLEI